MAGFAVVFGLWLLWGYQLVRSLADIEARVGTAQEAYARGEQLLLRIRTNVLLGSIYLRDALIDGASPRRAYYREELERLREEGERLLRTYVPQVASADERAQWTRLQSELDEYWASREVAFSVTGRTTLESAQVLRRQVVPRRESVLAIVDQLGALQAAAHDRHRREISLLVSDAELARRAQEQPVQPPIAERGYRKLFLATVTQADQGAITR